MTKSGLQLRIKEQFWPRKGRRQSGRQLRGMEKVLISGIMLATLGHRGETLQNKKELSDVKSVSLKDSISSLLSNAIFRNETGSLGALRQDKDNLFSR